METVQTGLLQLLFALSGAAIFLATSILLVRVLHLVMEPSLAWVRPLFERMDRFLALRFARWIGLDETSRFRRWGRLIAAFLGAAVIGALCPAPVAAPVLIVGLVGVVAVYRRWSWDEEDRAADLGPTHKRAPGVEDFNNELMLALASVFMLGSLLIWRLTGLHIFSERPGAGLMDGVLYVASEALEALPIFGNVEVFGYDNPARLEVVQPFGGWVAFALRMALDLLVIGGLLKILEIARRIARGQDLRRYDEAIAGGHDHKAQEAVATVAFYALRGDRGAIERLKSVAATSSSDLPPAMRIRRRLQAIHMIDSIVSDGAAGAYELLYFATLALDDIENDPDLEASGCLGMLHRQSASIWLAFSHRVTPSSYVECMDRALLHYSRAIDFEGDTLAFTNVASKASRAELIQEDRIDLLSNYADLLVLRSREAEGEESARFAQRSQAATRRLLAMISKDAAPEAWAQRMRQLGDALSCEGGANEGYPAGLLLTDALDSYDAALAVLSRTAHPGAWQTTQNSIAVTHHFLANLAESDETAKRHLELAIAASRMILDDVRADGEDALVEQQRWFLTLLLNLGHQHLALARRHDEDDPRQPELVCEARDFFFEAAGSDWARAEYYALWLDAVIQLRVCHHTMWRLTTGDDRKGHLSAALTAAKAVFDAIDSRHDPLGWADAACEYSMFQAQTGFEEQSGDLVLQALSRLSQARKCYEKVGLANGLERVDALVSEIEALLGYNPLADETS